MLAEQRPRRSVLLVAVGRTLPLLVTACVVGAAGCAPIDRWRVDSRLPSGGTKDFNLQWESLDPNGLPLNPYWAVQAADRWRVPPVSPACASGPPDSAACTDQRTSRDGPVGVHKDICGLMPGIFPGHVNWRPATYTGRVSWKNLADDGDVNLSFEPDDPARGMTSGNRWLGDDRGRPYIELEFASGQALFRFETDWWRSLRAAVEEWASAPVDAARIETLLNRRRPGQPSRATALGLFGLDCDHECKSELHPVFGLAIEVDDRVEDNVWALFVRNWGTEGYCSHRYHALELPDNLVRLVLPRKGQGVPRLLRESSQYAATFADSPPPIVSYDPAVGVIVTFAVPAPTESAVSELVLHLKWEGGSDNAQPGEAGREPPAYEDRPVTGTPNVALTVSRAATLGPQNVRIDLPPDMAMDPDPRSAPRRSVPASPPRARDTEVLEAKRRGDDTRVRLLCAEFRSVSNQLPPSWAKACAAAGVAPQRPEPLGR